MAHIDLSKYFAEKGCKMGRPRCDAVKMLKVILFAFMEEGYSALRKLEKLCKTDIRAELEFFKGNGIRLKVLDLPTTMTDYPTGQEWIFDMVNNILIEVLGSMAEQERLTIRQRQAEGISAAKEKGKHLGRPRAKVPENWTSVLEQWKSGAITAKRAMELTDTKRTTFYALVKGS